jgi:hypothetical protein
MSKLSISDIKSKYNPDQEVEHLRAQVADLNKRLKKERDATGEARLRAIQLGEAIESMEPVKMVYKATNKAETPITCVMQITDLHNGKVTCKSATDGFGEFSPEIFTRRLMELGSRVLDKVRTQRGGYNIPRLQIFGTGDYIEGELRREAVATNAYPPPVQAVRASRDIGALICMLAPHFESVTVDMLTLDNHGRLAHKNESAGGAENNYGYIIANYVQDLCARQSNVEVRVHAKPSAVVPVGLKERYLILHGHQMKGWAGLPYYGFDRRLMLEALKRMDITESRFTKMMTGHFHVATDTLYWMIGGSLSGTDEFDHDQGRHAPAHQTSWFVHEKHGQFDWTRWWLQ